LPHDHRDSLHAIPSDDGWLAPLNVEDATVVAPEPAPHFQGLIEESVWLPSEAIAIAWMQYVKDTAVSDLTPPPAPTNLRIKDNELIWEAEADFESGLAGFIVQRDGKFLARVPQQSKNPFGRPIFQNLQYSDTPTQPLVEMRFTDENADPCKVHQYRVIAVNTVGLTSE